MGVGSNTAGGFLTGLTTGGPVGGIIGAGIGLFGSLFGAHEQSSAASDAAKAQADAARYAADKESQAAAASLAYQQQQAAQTQANFETTQRANYGQYASRQRDINNLGAIIGAPTRNIPDYVPTTNVSGPAQGSTPPPGSLASAPAPNLSTSAPPAVDGSAASISAYFKSQGAPDTETPYWVSKWPELVARGQELGDPNYAIKRLAAADILGGGGQSSTQTIKAPAPYGSLASVNLPFQAAPQLTLRGY